MLGSADTAWVDAEHAGVGIEDMKRLSSSAATSSFLRQPRLCLPRGFLPRERKTLMFYTRRRALITLLLISFFQILVVPRVVRGQNVQSLYYSREKFWPSLRKNISLSLPPID